MLQCCYCRMTVCVERGSAAWKNQQDINVREPCSPTVSKHCDHSPSPTLTLRFNLTKPNLNHATVTTYNYIFAKVLAHQIGKRLFVLLSVWRVYLVLHQFIWRTFHHIQTEIVQYFSEWPNTCKIFCYHIQLRFICYCLLWHYNNLHTVCHLPVVVFFCCLFNALLMSSYCHVLDILLCFNFYFILLSFKYNFNVFWISYFNVFLAVVFSFSLLFRCFCFSVYCLLDAILMSS